MELYVFQPQQRTWADRGRRVDRHLAVGRRELEDDLCPHASTLQPHRAHVRHEAHPVSPRQHLVAGEERRPVGDVDLELLGGDKRQAVVSVVGQEHGHDRHEHSDRSDQHRVPPHLDIVGKSEGAGSCLVRRDREDQRRH